MQSRVSVKVILYPAVTLDGYIADLNGECYSWISEEDEAFYDAAIKKAGCSLVGRKTYEQYIDDFPPKNGSTTFVYTTAENKQDSDKIKFVHGSPAEVLQQIASHGFEEVIVSGGGEVNGALAAAGVVDEIIVSIYGVILGEGVPLFGSHKPQLRLELISSSQQVPGIVKNHYKVI